MISLFFFIYLSSFDLEQKCFRCGKCCFYELDGKIKKCKHLVILRNTKTLCRIYKQRLKVNWKPLRIDKKTYCISRKKDTRKFIFCPLNS